jgi:hypothetical protein
VEISTIKEACLRSAEAGLDGLAITGEASPLYTSCELNYLALAHFSYHPQDSLRAFATHTLAPLTGGSQAAQEFVTFLAKRQAGTMTTADEQRLQERLRQSMAAAAKGEEWRLYRRWRWLSTAYTSQMVDGTGALLTL